MKTRVHGRVLLAVGGAALLAVPFATQAKNQIGMDACIAAFVSERIPENHPLKIVKRDTIKWAFPQDNTIVITTEGRRTGESYGSTTCMVNRKGEVVAMDIQGERVRYADRGAVKQQPRG